MTTNNITKSDVLCTEAIASWNTRYINPEGFECQLTLRADTGQEVLEKALGAIAFLLKNGCTPFVKSNFHSQANNGHDDNPNSSSQPASENGNNGNQDRSWCPIHECTMKRWEKDGRVWFSHKVNGDWCSGKVKSK